MGTYDTYLEGPLGVGVAVSVQSEDACMMYDVLCVIYVCMYICMYACVYVCLTVHRSCRCELKHTGLQSLPS
jgi:hypothetical protein